MGRDKDSSARKAGGRTAASSSAAAAMVAAMGAGSGLTFSAFDPTATSVEQELDPDIALALKKLSKKDSTTKIKALGELLGFFEVDGGRTEDEIALILPQWQQPFQTLAIDADRRVREALFVTLGALVVRVKKHMTKHLRGLMLPWLCARFDTEASVRTAANAAFVALFPPAKIADALLYCKPDIVHGIDSNMAHTVQTLCDPKIFSKEEADDTIARVHASSLLTIAHVLEALSIDQALKFASELETLRKPVFWKFPTNASVHVRAAFYTALRALTAQAPSLLSDEQAAAGESNSRLKLAAAAVMQGLSDKDSAAHSQMWECLLVFSRAFPGALAAMDMSKSVLPRLFALVKNADKIHVGLLQSLWEALASMRATRAIDDGARSATLRAYFECLLHGWQQSAADGLDHLQVAQRVESVTTAGLLPCLDALLLPDASSDAAGGGGGGGGGGRGGVRGQLLTQTVKCMELLCCRDELGVARRHALKLLVARLQTCCDALAGGGVGGSGKAAEEEAAARNLSELVCAFKRDGQGRAHLLRIMSAVCKTLLAKGWTPSDYRSVALPRLAVLCDLLAHWGGQVLSMSEDTEDAAMLSTQTDMQSTQTASSCSSLLQTCVVPLIVSTLDEVSKEGADAALPDEAKEVLGVLFRLSSLLIVEHEAGDEGEGELWVRVLTSVGAGGSRLPQQCTRVEALALLVESVARVKDNTVKAFKPQRFICEDLDAMVLDASVRLLLRQGHREEPGMLLASKLHALVVAVLPDNKQESQGAFLISEAALIRLMERFSGVMQTWAGMAQEGCRQDEALIEGASVTAAMSSAAMAGLETVERVLAASLAQGLTDGGRKYLTPILGALFRLRMHTESMIAGSVADGAREVYELVGDRVLFDHSANMASRMRSRTGLRACVLWDSCARAVLVRMLERETSNGVSWVLERAKEISDSVHASVLVTRAFVLADQATELVKIARACEYNVTDILKALLRKCESLPQGSSSSERCASMCLAFGLRLMHCLGLDTVLELLDDSTSALNAAAPLWWLFEEIVLVYGERSPLKPLPGPFCRCRTAHTSLWSLSAVCGNEAEEEREGMEERLDAIGGTKDDSRNSTLAELSQDVALAWKRLVTPVLVGDVGTPPEGRGLSKFAHHLALKSMGKTLEGCSQWPRAFLHILSLLARSGGTKYLKLCSEMLSSLGVDACGRWLSQSGASMLGMARVVVVLVKAISDVVRSSEEEVSKALVGDKLLYSSGVDGVTEEVLVLAVHREEFPPFFSIRMCDGREKQTEAHRLCSISWLSTISHDCGASSDSIALLIGLLRKQLSGMAEQCARHVLDNARSIGSALGSAQSSDDDSTRAVAALVLIALRELCRCSQHHLMGPKLWLSVLEHSCQWFDPLRQLSLPSPESAYMLAATAGIVTGGHDIGSESQDTSYCLADALDGDSGVTVQQRLDASIVSYWFAQLAAEPNGACVRALCARHASWAQLTARVHAVIVSKSFWGSAAQAAAMQTLHLLQSFAVVVEGASDSNGPQPPAPAAAPHRGSSSTHTQDARDEEEDDEDEVIELLDDDENDEDSPSAAPRDAVLSGASASSTAAASEQAAAASEQAAAAWQRCRLSGFAHVLGELISVRNTSSVAELPRQLVSRLRLLALVAAAAPKDALELSLVHLDRKRRQTLCEALHSLLSATEVVVQTSSFALLLRYYSMPALLMHLDALEWEGLEAEREGDEDGQERGPPATPPSPALRNLAVPDLLRAIPKPLATALRTSAKAAASATPPASPQATEGRQLARSGSPRQLAAEEALMSTEALGVLLAWLLVLVFRPRCSTRLQGNISAYLRGQTLIQPLLSIAFAHVVSLDGGAAAASPGLSLSQRPPSSQLLALEALPDLAALGHEEEATAAMQHLATHILYHSVGAFPSLVRVWYNDLDRGTALRVDKFVATAISPLILEKEVAGISEAAGSIDETGELTIRASAKTREITASYVKDEAVLEVVLRVPASYPLQPIAVDGTRRVGVSEGKWKKWALAMRTLLDNKDGSLLDAVLLWKKNVDQVFEGVEECPICYTVIHMVNNTLPRLRCHTCKNKFHSACLYKWFNTSNKSACPLCQSPWYS